jgi:serine/threonine protein kinase
MATAFTVRIENRCLPPTDGHIHEARVRYRDIGADNLLVNPTVGEVFVIDFDLAEIAGWGNFVPLYPNYDIEVQCLRNTFNKKYEPDERCFGLVQQLYFIQKAVDSRIIYCN